MSGVLKTSGYFTQHFTGVALTKEMDEPVHKNDLECEWKYIKTSESPGRGGLGSPLTD